MKTLNKTINNNNIPVNKVTLTKEEKNEIYRNKFKRAIFILAMIIVPLANFFVFYLYVNFSSIMMAFEDVNGNLNFNRLIDIGSRVFSSDGDFLVYLGNTMIYFLNSIVVMMPLITFIAYFIYKKIFMYKFFRVMFFLPAIVSSLIFVTLYKALWANGGAIYTFLTETCGVVAPSDGFLASENWAKWMILIYTIWTGFGTNLILMTGAMNRIPEEVLEAATLDGVGVARELVSIILPLIWPTITTLLVLAFTGIFTASGPLLLFTPNGEADTMTISYYIFRAAKQGGTNSLREGAALGLFFTLIGMPIILGVKKLLERWQDAIEY